MDLNFKLVLQLGLFAINFGEKYKSLIFFFMLTYNFELKQLTHVARKKYTVLNSFTRKSLHKSLTNKFHAQIYELQI